TYTTVASLDSSGPADKGRWEDWTHLGNLLQFLGGASVITTTRTWTPDGEEPPPGLPPATTAAPPAPAGTDTTAGLLDDCYDLAARALAETAIAAGHTGLVVGYEPGDPDGTVLEVAWPAQKVGILPTGATQPGALPGWVVRTPEQWESDALLVALTEGAQP
ncbi:MAG: hypothetical protein ACRDPR_13355, partial [Nocardioidaceae bacterium]